jgi:hypothetical protein
MFYKELLLLLLLLLLLVTFIHGIYKYIPETNHVSRVYSVAATLWLQFMVPAVMLFPKTNISYFYSFSSFVVWVLLIRLFFLFIAVPRVSRECKVHCSLALLAKIRLCENGFASFHFRCSWSPSARLFITITIIFIPFPYTYKYYHVFNYNDNQK